MYESRAGNRSYGLVHDVLVQSMLQVPEHFEFVAGAYFIVCVTTNGSVLTRSSAICTRMHSDPRTTISDYNERLQFIQ